MSDPTGGAGERDPNAPEPQNAVPNDGNVSGQQAPQASFGDQPGAAEQATSNGYGVGSSFGSTGDNYQSPSNYTAPGGSYEASGSTSGYQGGPSSYSGSTGSSVPSASASGSGYSSPSAGSYSSPSAGGYTGDTSYTAPSASGSDYAAPSYGSTPDYSGAGNYGSDQNSYGSAPAADAYGAPAADAYGSAPAADAYGAPAQNAYGSTPDAYGAAPDAYGANAYGAAPQDANAAPGYGAAPAYGAAGGAGGGQQQYGNYAPQGQGGFNVLGLIAVIAGGLALLIALIPVFGYVSIVLSLAAIGLGIAGLLVKRFNAKKLLAIIGLALGGLGLIAGPIITTATTVNTFASQIPDETDTETLFGDDYSTLDSGAPAEGEMDVEITVTSTSTTPVTVKYSWDNDMTGADRVQVDTEEIAAAVPWSKSVTMSYKADYGYESSNAYVYASTADYTDQSQLTCTITVNGNVVTEATSSRSVSCSGYSLADYLTVE